MFNTINIIYVYIYIIITLIVFDLFYTTNEKIQIKRGKKKLEKFKKSINEQLVKIKQNAKVDENHKKMLLRKLKNVNNLLIYQEVIRQLKIEQEELVDKYLVVYTSIFQVFSQSYRNKDSIYKAFFASFLSKFYPFHLNTNSIIDEEIIKYVKDKSVYCRENAMLYLYKRGSAKLVVNALKAMDGQELYYHKKLLSNDLLKFQGNQNELAKLLFEAFDQFSIDFQVSIVNYLRFSNMNFNDDFYEMLMSHSYDKEVELAIIRYFGKKIYMPVLSYLLSILRDDQIDVEYKIIVCQVIGAYHKDQVKEALIDCISHENWYVRKNATKSLSKMHLTNEDKNKIKNISDRYGKQMVNYTFKSRNMLKNEGVVVQ